MKIIKAWRNYSLTLSDLIQTLGNSASRKKFVEDYEKKLRKKFHGNKYHSSFPEEAKTLFDKHKVETEFANENKKFPPGYICHLWDLKLGFAPNNNEIKELLDKAGWNSPEPWEDFDIRRALTYTLEDKCLIETKILMEHEIDDETAHKYNVIHFSAPGVIMFLEAGMSAEELEIYHAGCPHCHEHEGNHHYNLSADHILKLWGLGIKGEEASLYLQYKLHPFVNDFLQYKEEGSIRCVGTGASGLVMFDSSKEVAYKFSNEAEEEAYLLYDLDSEHIVKYIDEENGHLATCTFFSPPDCGTCSYKVIHMEYIKGPTLEKLIQQGPLGRGKVLLYSKQILQGLQDMSNANIYHHRDLRPANVMIDEEKNRAVIIDLGIASRKKDALSQDNRRFGSASGRVANDLNSLGQVMYYIATGKKVFSKSKSMDRTTFADGYKDFRDSVYDDPRKLRYFCDKVRGTLDEELAGLVIFCLRSEGTEKDYATLKEKFDLIG